MGSDAISSVGQRVEFFDFALLKSDFFIKHGILDYEPVLRDKGPLLSYVSCHPARLHFAWPIAYVQRLHRRSSRLDHFFRARAHFEARLRAHGVPECIIDYVIDNTDYYVPHHKLNNVKRPALQTSRFLVLPFHPLWSHAKLSAVAGSFSKDPDHCRLLQEAFRSHDPFLVAVSWKLMSAPLGSTLVEW